MKVKVVAGMALHCRSRDDANSTTTSQPRHDDIFGTVLALAFSPEGDLYVAESDTRRVNSIRLVDPSGKINHFAGKIHERTKNGCECNSSATTANPRGSQELPTACICGSTDVTTSNAETLLSSNAKFQSISALTVSPGGVLHVADQGSLHVLALEHYLPSHDENGEFHVPYPAAGEVYVFNR